MKKWDMKTQSVGKVKAKLKRCTEHRYETTATDEAGNRWRRTGALSYRPCSWSTALSEGDFVACDWFQIPAKAILAIADAIKEEREKRKGWK